MRDIKFRAWNSDTKKMIDLKKITPLALNMEADGLFLPFSDDLPLMQYTGLKDKNGKEIYEGDLIAHKFYNTPVLVEWNYCGFEFGDISPYSDGIEVIGNIYENQEKL